MLREVRKFAAGAYCLALLGCALCLAQAVHPITGRPIAPVLGGADADWLDRPDRAMEEQPAKALAAMNLRPGMMVAEVGAGTGFYTLRMAPYVAPGGVVYANDIQPEMLQKLAARAQARNIGNIEIVLGTESDPRLPEAKLDLVLLADSYHEFSRPERMLEKIRESLKPGGELVILEFRKEDATVPIRPEHKMTVEEVKSEVTPEGYQFEKVVDTLPWQHMIFFRRATP